MRRVSENGLRKIKGWEARGGVPDLVPYQDQAGVWTNGYGNTNGVTPGVVITFAQAEADLRRNLLVAERAVSDLVRVDLSENQFDALVSFVFNVGAAAFKASTLLRRLNAGDYAAVPIELMRWNKVTIHGKRVVNAGLTNRRAAEAGLWAKGEHVASANIAPLMGEPVPLSRSRTLQGVGVSSLGATGAALTDAASQVQLVAEYSNTLRIVFVGLILAGLGLSLYGRLRLRREEGV